MYRDQREAVRQRILLVEADHQELDKRYRRLTAAVERRRGWKRKIRRAWLIPVLSTCLLVATLVAVPWATYATDRRRADARDVLRSELSLRLEELRAERQRQREEAERLLSPLREPVAPDARARRIFAQLRTYDATSADDAWVIVGGTACALDDSELSTRAEVALGDNEEKRVALNALCGGRP